MLCGAKLPRQRPGHQATKDVTHCKARTPPVGFVSATMRPSRSASATSLGTFAAASLSAACPRSSAVVSFSMTNMRCSFVHPDGPAAAPRRALRKLISKSALQTWAGAADIGSTLGWMGTCASGGRRTGSRSAWSVSAVAGAKGGAVRALAAADISPRCASAEARSARRRMSLSEPTCGDSGARTASRTGWAGWAAATLSRSNCVQLPSQNKRSRRLNS